MEKFPDNNNIHLKESQFLAVDIQHQPQMGTDHCIKECGDNRNGWLFQEPKRAAGL